MKKILKISFIILGLYLIAIRANVIPLVGNTYYFSDVSGDDSRTSAQAQNVATPWKTISKLNSFFSSLSPGDQVLFRRGETFVGTIVPTRSGTSGLPITLGAYGAGARPIITTLQSVTSWTNISGNIWESTAAVSTLSTLMVCVDDDVLLRVARFPNTTYNSVDAFNITVGSSSNTITDAALTQTITDITDGQIVVRSSPWTLDHMEINSRSGTTINFGNGISYGSTSGSPMKVGMGYFLQNYASALDVAGEYYYNPTTKKLRIYSVGSPTNVKVSNLENLVIAAARSFITIDNINFQGANLDGITFTGASNSVTVQNCDVSYIGDEAISISGTSPIVQSCNITYSLNKAIGMSKGIVRDNIAINIAHIGGMNQNMAGHAAIANTGDNAVTEYNIVKNTGYLAIRAGYNSSKCNYNYVENWAMNRNDAGAIYVQGNYQKIYNNVEIKGNICINAANSTAGTTNTTSSGLGTYGIYLDDAMTGTTIKGNTLSGMLAGIFLHGNKDIIVIENTSYNNSSAQLYITNNISPNAYPTSGMTIRKNIFVAKTGGTGGQKVVYWSYKTSDVVANFGTSRGIDSNWYARPIDTTGIPFSKIVQLQKVGSAGVDYTLAQWRATVWNPGSKNFDFSTKHAPRNISDTSKIRLVFNPNKTDTTIFLDSLYISVDNIAYNTGSITLAPFASKVLIKNGPRTGNILPTVSLTAPTNGQVFTALTNITLTATAADADGSISKVEFYNGATLLFTDVTAPYTQTWTNVNVGTYSLTAKAFDNSAASTTSTAVSVTVNNALPVVDIVSPSDNSTFITPNTTVNFEADASDANSTITKVEFFSNGGLFQTENNAPYLFSRNFPNVGDYVITAKAFDSHGGTTTSAPITFTVSVTPDNASPTVSITAPADQEVFSNPADIVLSASAADVDGTIASVAFYNGATLLNTDNAAPYSYVWPNVPIGIYSVTAKAIDNDGAETISAPITINVQNVAPNVDITDPVTGERFESPGAILIEAVASDINGTITEVKFFNGTTLLNTDVAAPFEYNWTGVPIGTYDISAITTDNDGAVDTSLVVVVHVENTPPTVSVDATVITGFSPGEVLIEAEATDLKTITKVDFYADSVLLFSDDTAPYSYTWTGVVAGAYTITAKATDNEGAVSTAEIYVAINNLKIRLINRRVVTE